ncbi:unnamed protein product [Penicillium salamii]|uniref:Uncharacterized protein n=1 Tax=Penicillium salamii TaxID=1612424 RepID=A0A9W4N1H2_9EURO|nr:unnamed protein product [Penicillium salamii]CAG8255006.1 unnamed protein product [Penicillium salamii]
MPRFTQAQVEKDESKLFAYREEHFKMAARVDISRLVFDKNFKRQMSNRQNIDRLERIMSTQGCHRLMEECHVPVLVSARDWGSRVRPRTADGQFQQLDVDIDYELRGLDHESLIIAARNRLRPSNQWWIVDVYVTEPMGSEQPLEKEFIRSLQERFPNDHRPSDGLIYQRIRYYEGYLDGPINTNAANQWWATLERVSGSKKSKYLRAFLKHPTLPQAFDELLPIAGIWEGMKIGVLHKLVAMRCDEPVLCYLAHIKRTFTNLVGHRYDLLAQLDGVTIQFLTSRVPKISARDLRFLEVRMLKEELFPDIDNAQDRVEIWERLKNIDYPIPTLETFFQDRLILEVGRSVLQRICIPDPQRKLTIDEELGEQYDTAVPVLASDRQYRIRSQLFEFWRFSFQYGFDMTNHQRRIPRTESRIQRTAVLGSTESQNTPDRMGLWQRLFWLASESRFRIPSVDGTSGRPAELPPLIPCDYPESFEEELPVERRCGRPYTDSVDADRFALSREALERPRAEFRVTSGFAQRSVFLAFFRYLKADSESRSFPEDSPENNNTSASEFLTGVSNPDEMIPSSFTAPQENTMPLPPVLATPQFDPILESPALDLQPTCFTMIFVLPGEPEKAAELPNDQSTLNTFFEDLRRQKFYIYSPDNPARGINERECYSIYFKNPLLKLHAEFLGEESFITILYQPEEESHGTIGRKRRRRDDFFGIGEAKRWLDERLNGLLSVNHASQFTIPPPH